jgi:hypothetical protein
MGAALQIARAEELPRKTGGGSGGGGFAELAARVYQDDRANHEARELLLAVAYGVTMARDDKGQPWKAATNALGRDKAGYWRINKLVTADSPRYAPPYAATAPRGSNAPGCEAPRLRPYKPRRYQPRGGEEQPTNLLAHRLPEPIVWVPPGYTPPVDERNEHMICGADGYHRVIELHPVTGWYTAHWFCRRHQDHADRVREQVRAQNEAAPKPIPNRGGLLASYFEADWAKVYQHYVGEHWEPNPYGLCADDWPVPGRDLITPRIRLKLAAVDGELVGGM